MCILSGTVCALASLAVHAKFINGSGSRKLICRPQSQPYFCFINWTQLSNEELSEEVLRLILSQPGMLFGWHNPVLSSYKSIGASGNNDGKDHDDLSQKEYKNFMLMYFTHVADSQRYLVDRVKQIFCANKSQEEMQ